MMNLNNANQRNLISYHPVSYPNVDSQKTESFKILKDIKSICHNIIKDCNRDHLDEVVNQVDQLSSRLDQIDESEVMTFGKHAAGEMISILQLVHHANSLMISKGITNLYNDHFDNSQNY